MRGSREHACPGVFAVPLRLPVWGSCRSARATGRQVESRGEAGASRKTPCAGPEHDRARGAQHQLLLGGALVGLVAFHTLGNAVALVLSVPRRPPQAFLLGAFAVLGFDNYACSRGVRAFLRSREVRWVLCSLAAAASFVAIRAGLALAHATPVTPYAALVGLVAPLWLAVAVCTLATGAPVVRPSDRAVDVAGFGADVTALLGLLFSVAYFQGPEPRDVMMAFGGSTIQAGVAGAALAGVALVALRGWQQAVGLTLALHLVFVATSRTGFVVLVALLAAHLLSIVLFGGSARPRARHCATSLAVVGACALLVVLPARGSFFWPYFSSRPGVVRVERPGAPLTEWEAFVERFGRLPRPVLVGGDLGPGGVPDALRGADSRWSLLLDTLKAIAANPWGYWPRPFEEVTRIACGDPLVCRYPHNLLLEVGFHFGWVPLAVLVAGLGALAVRAVGLLMDATLPARVAAVGFLAYLGAAQFSGNLVDSLYVLAFALALHAMHPRPATARDSNEPWPVACG